MLWKTTVKIVLDYYYNYHRLATITIQRDNGALIAYKVITVCIIRIFRRQLNALSLSLLLFPIPFNYPTSTSMSYAFSRILIIHIN